MLEEMMIYARGLTDWPRDIFKDIGNNTYRGKSGRSNVGGRKKKQNMNHVRRATKLKHRRAR